MRLTPTLPWRDIPGFDGLYGLQIDAISDEEVVANVVVRDELRQPAGLVHGGVLASMAESMTSASTLGLGIAAQHRACGG